MACGPPGSGRSMGDAAPSGGEAAPGGRAGMTEGCSGGGSECMVISVQDLLPPYIIYRCSTVKCLLALTFYEYVPDFQTFRDQQISNCKTRFVQISSYLSSCPAVCHPARCCCPAGCRKSWRGRSPRAQMRCDWRRRKPSRRTPSPCAASSPDRRQRHSQLHGSVSPPGGAKTVNITHSLKVISTLNLELSISD